MLSMTGYSSVGSKKQAQVHMNFLVQLAGQLGREIAMLDCQMAISRGVCGGVPGKAL